MADTRVIVRNCFDFVEAETLRLRLETAGIAAWVTGTDSAVALSMGGAGTDRLIRVEVAAQDGPEASDILAADAERLRNARPWFCSRCDERNEPAFEVCWSCNKPFNESDAGHQPPSQEPKSPPLDERAFLASATTPTTPEVDLNPYRPATETLPSSSDDPNSSAAKRFDDSRSAIDNDDDDDPLQDAVRRIYLSAIVGLLVFPPLPNLYSLMLLLALPGDTYSMPRFRRRIFAAWTINLASIIGWSAVFLWSIR